MTKGGGSGAGTNAGRLLESNGGKSAPIDEKYLPSRSARSLPGTNTSPLVMFILGDTLFLPVICLKQFHHWQEILDTHAQ